MPATEPTRIDFQIDPSAYKHWDLLINGDVATLKMSVDPDQGLRNDYELKMNSYDLAVDIELYDIVQRLRFEYPGVKTVVMTGGLDKIFCAGANIQMLASSTHQHKVNFCKFTNETRNSIEDASAHSGQTWLAAVNGTAAGGGYELALACEEILLIDDRASAVSLPEIPLLAVLPGTGGLTRLVDKRHVRRDLADAFATRTEGARAKQALSWGLVDAAAPGREFQALIDDRTAHYAALSDRPDGGTPVVLTPLDRVMGEDTVEYTNVGIKIDRRLGTAEIAVTGPSQPLPDTVADFEAVGAQSWILATARELDDAFLHMRFNETAIGTWILKTRGSATNVLAAERMLSPEHDSWLVREARLYWARTLKRLDLSARSIIALIEPGSCFSGLLAELVLAADRSYMLDGTWENSDIPAPAMELSDANTGWFAMSNGLSRMESRFWGRPDVLAAATEVVGTSLDAAAAAEAELITFEMDDIDWADEIRVMLEERNSFSPDALTGMEANFRFVGPETMETKIFARLSAWQNWIFQRPNAVGPAGALQRFGTGSRPDFDQKRV
jgi:benzoyl-CoA-dihydrodiol lyase